MTLGLQGMIMNNKNLTMRDGAAELLEVMLDKRRTWFSQPTAQRIKTSCSDDVPLTSIHRWLSVHNRCRGNSVHKYVGLSLSTWDSAAGALTCANNPAVSSRGSTASTCHSGVLITLLSS